VLPIFVEFRDDLLPEDLETLRDFVGAHVVAREAEHKLVEPTFE